MSSGGGDAKLFARVRTLHAGRVIRYLKGLCDGRIFLYMPLLHLNPFPIFTACDQVAQTTFPFYTTTPNRL